MFLIVQKKKNVILAAYIVMFTPIFVMCFLFLIYTSFDLCKV